MSVHARTPSAQYATTIRLDCPHKPGWIARIASAIAQAGGAIQAIDLVHIERGTSLRDYTVECTSTKHAKEIVKSIKRIEDVTVHSVSDNTFLQHLGGKIEIRSRVPLETRADLSMAYTPGVARVCEAIRQDVDASYTLTIRKNCIAVVSDGSAVLGMGNIGAAAAMPVMEGKAILFKKFGGVDAVPLCVDTQDASEIIAFCKAIATSFGGINLEDITAPKCFEVENELRRSVDIPVFHDDQHGTAVVVLAGVINALRITGKKLAGMKLVVAGAGAAGYACTRSLYEFGITNAIVCDRKGAIHRGREDCGENPAKTWMMEKTNPNDQRGSLQDVLVGADMFLGVSAPGILSREDVLKMNADPILFAMSNPTPEIMPEEVEGIAAIMGTGRSDYPNQINNVLAFPGIFRGALDARACEINEEMKRAAAHAIAATISDEELSPDYVLPSVFNRRVAKQVGRAVTCAARESGVARRVHKTTSIPD